MQRWLFICLALMALPGSSRAEEPRLTKRRVARLADAAAKHAGYDLRRFRRLAPEFSPGGYGHDWIVLYDGKPDRNSMSTIGNHFFVHVADSDGHTSISPGR